MRSRTSLIFVAARERARSAPSARMARATSGFMVQVGEPGLNRRKRRNDDFGQITLEGAIAFSGVTVLDGRNRFSVEKAVDRQQVR